MTTALLVVGFPNRYFLPHQNISITNKVMNISHSVNVNVS